MPGIGKVHSDRLACIVVIVNHQNCSHNLMAARLMPYPKSVAA
jgi:hypothetical protein